jgi:hypothetical protein
MTSLDPFPDRSGRLSCQFGLHRWIPQPDQLGCYGMGLETFEVWHCGDCPATCDRLKGLQRDGRSHYPCVINDDRLSIPWWGSAIIVGVGVAAMGLVLWGWGWG